MQAVTKHSSFTITCTTDNKDFVGYNDMRLEVHILTK